jgi:hypothetical protein
MAVQDKQVVDVPRPSVDVAQALADDDPQERALGRCAAA